jgi:hypothetical protein
LYVPSRQTGHSNVATSDPERLPFNAVLLCEWPVWQSPTEFNGDIWLISGLHYLFEKSQPLARYHDAKWTLYAQPVEYPTQLVADAVGMLVAGDNGVAVRKASERWKMISAPVAMPAKRDGVPGITYSGGSFVGATYAERTWRYNWQNANWETAKASPSADNELHDSVLKHNPKIEFAGHSGRVYWSACNTRQLDGPREEMHNEPLDTLFVRQHRLLYIARKNGSLETIPYLPFIEWLRDDGEIMSPSGPVQIDSSGVLYQLVVGLKNDRGSIVRLLPEAGVYRPIAHLPGPAEAFWLRGAPLWRVNRDVFSLDGTRKVTELPPEFDEAANQVKAGSREATLIFSRTETIVSLDTGIIRYEGQSWAFYTWQQLGIRKIEDRYVTAAVEINPRITLVPEFTPKYAADSDLFMRWHQLEATERDDEAFVLDLNHINLGVRKRKIARLRAPRPLMPETAGFLSGNGSRTFLFYDRNSVYETQDTWNGYWHGFVGFTPYFHAGGVFLADVE